MKKEIFNEEVAAQIAGALLGAQAFQLKSEAPYFVWASGWHSPIYCDNRKLQSYLEERELIADSLCSLIEQEYPEAEAIISVATGAIPWGTLAGWLLDIPTAYIRSDKKDHGLQNRIEGALKSGIKVVIVEDLISTGGSSLSAVQAVREAGFEVLGMAALFTYGFQKSRDAFEEAGCQLNTLSDYETLVAQAVKTNYIPADKLDFLAKWREAPQDWDK